MRTEVRIAGLKYHDVNDLRMENSDWYLTSKVIRECFSEGDKIFRYEYPREPVQVALEPENIYDDTALAVYVAGKQVGYVAKEQKQKVFDLHHQDVHVWAEIDGGPVKIVGSSSVLTREYPLMGRLVFEGNIEEEPAPTPPPPPKPKTLPPVIFYVLGALLLVVSLLSLIVTPVIGVAGIVLSILVFMYGRKMKRLRDEYNKR